MGGEERILRTCLRPAAAAADALRLPPRKRLERTVAQWSGLLSEDLPPTTPDDSADAVTTAELTHMLRVRVAEIDAALSSGDVDGAFDLLRNITVTRDGEGHPVSVAIPDDLVPDSAFWLLARSEPKPGQLTRSDTSGFGVHVPEPAPETR